MHQYKVDAVQVRHTKRGTLAASHKLHAINNAAAIVTESDVPAVITDACNALSLYCEQHSNSNTHIRMQSLLCSVTYCIHSYVCWNVQANVAGAWVVKAKYHTVVNDAHSAADHP